MTLNEATRIIVIICMNYPDTQRGMTDDERKTYAKNWHFFFKDDSYAEVLAAVQKIISSSQERFAPNIGMIREQMRKNREPKSGLSEQEAWELVKRALRNGLYGYKEEFAKLPPTVQRCVGSENMIREWAAMESETLDSVVASNFMRSFRAIRQSAEEEARTPAAMREQLEAFRDKALLSIEAPSKAPSKTPSEAFLEAPLEKKPDKPKERPLPVMPKLDAMYLLATEEETQKMKQEQLAKLEAMIGG